jgi:RNA polymerase sigma-70 factor, ECF subfamily
MATPATTATVLERDLLDAARGGDEAAYGRLVEPHRGALHAHCYRMLGSVHDAEDALQDALLRAWRGLPRFEGRSSLRSWLYKIATNTCLNAIARRPKRMLPIDHGPPADPHDPPGAPLVETTWVEPYPDERLGVEDGRAAPEARYECREGVELAFVAALQHLPPNQRAALLLRDVLALSARETADAMETTVASVTSALQHARTRVAEWMPDESQQATLHELGDERLHRIVEGYTSALAHGDVDAMVELLAEDVTWSMPPWREWYRGLADVRAFLAAKPMSQAWRHLPANANGQLTVGCYMRDEDGTYGACVIDVIELRGDRIASVTGFFLDADRFAAFGLPGVMIS